VIVVELVFPGLRESPFEEGSAAIKATFTLLFGLILALTIPNLSSNSSNASTVASNESTALTQISRTSQGLHLGERRRVRARSTSISTRWPRTSSRRCARAAPSAR
jgi:hypothetical protein